MTPTVESLEAGALALSPEDRRRLLDRLAFSLEVDPEVEAAWEVEADRREADLENGSARLVPGDEVLARLKAKYL